MRTVFAYVERSSRGCRGHMGACGKEQLRCGWQRSGKRDHNPKQQEDCSLMLGSIDNTPQECSGSGDGAKRRLQPWADAVGLSGHHGGHSCKRRLVGNKGRQTNAWLTPALRMEIPSRLGQSSPMSPLSCLTRLRQEFI
eukprot:2452255-Pleurochrysis_carterae.AAC.1